jgi:hypothetical protein
VVFLIRLLHGVISAFFIACIAIVFRAAVTGRRDRLLYPAIAALILEGAIVFTNGGNCPLGRVHHQYGDDRDFFELFMPKRLSRHAVPVLTAVTVLGIVLALRPRSKAPARS